MASGELSNALEYGHKWFEKPRGRDIPKHFAAVMAWHLENCTLLFKVNGTVTAYGTSSEKPRGMITCRLDLNSQKPVVTIGFNQLDTTTTLSYDTQNYEFSWSNEPAAVKNICDNHSALCEIAHKSGAIVVALKKKRASSAPVSMGHHPDRLVNDSTGIVDAYHAAAGEEKLAIFRITTPVRAKVCDYFKQLQEMKSVAVEGAIQSTDYWHYASQEDFKDKPGMYMWDFALKKNLPVFPYWLATKWSAPARGQPSQATEVAELPSRNYFHDMKEYEIVMCSALLWKRKESIVALERLFDNRTVHSGTIEPASKSGRSDRAWISVDITMNEAMGLIIPVPPLSVKVNIELDVEDMVGEDRIIGEVRGEVSDRPTDADFLIYAKLPQRISRGYRGRWPPGSAFRPNITPTPLIGCSTPRARQYWPTAQEADLKFGTKVQLWNFLREDEKEHFHSKMGEIKRILTLDQSQDKAFDDVFGDVAAGLVIIQGPPGTGKTRVNAGIAIFAAFLGLKVLVAAGSNGAVDALMLKIVELLEDNPQIRLPGIVVRYRAPAKTALQLIGQESQTQALRALAVIEEQMEKGESPDDKALNHYAMSAYVKHAIRQGMQKGEEFWQELNSKIEDMRKGVRSSKHGNKLPHIFAENQDKAERIILKGDVSIVGSTLNTSFHDTVDCCKFDLVLLDENCQSLEPDALIALMKGPAVVVLTGDHKQLPPTVISLGTGHNPYAPQLATSLFARLIGQGYPYHMLRTQYRMHPHISAQPNRTTYEGKLLDDACTSAVTPLSLFFEDFIAKHARLSKMGRKRRIVIDVPGPSTQPRGSLSWYNKGQLEVMDMLIRDLLNFRSEAEGAARQIDGRDIGIITPYKEQKRRINRSNLGEAQKQDPVEGITDVRVATTDAYQGRESEVMLVNLTGIDGPKGRAGHMQDPRRLNVALTRAKKGMFVIMDYTSFSSRTVKQSLNRYTGGTLVEFLNSVKATSCVVKWVAPSTPGPSSGGIGTLGQSTDSRKHARSTSTAQVEKAAPKKAKPGAVQPSSSAFSSHNQPTRAPIESLDSGKDVEMVEGKMEEGEVDDLDVVEETPDLGSILRGQASPPPPAPSPPTFTPSSLLAPSPLLTPRVLLPPSLSPHSFPPLADRARPAAISSADLGPPRADPPVSSSYRPYRPPHALGVTDRSPYESGWQRPAVPIREGPNPITGLTRAQQEAQDQATREKEKEKTSMQGDDEIDWEDGELNS
ncbi:hypothetical protein MMC18_007605 [Xylographa bjoerkii]|nr:hypothetical protein [Xylographa bjoerkii]